MPKIALPAAERAYQEIRRRILAIEMAPNTPASEVKLAASLGMSRTPVREALTRLSTEGLIDLRARAGTIVSPIRPEAVRTAQYVREALELRILREAARSSDKGALFRINQAVEEQEFAISQSNVGQFYLADDKMHRAFCELAGREDVWFVVSDAKKHMDRVRRMSLREIKLQVLLDDHLRIVTAISAHDDRAACEVMKTHLRRVHGDLDRLIAKHPRYFELPCGADPQQGRAREESQ